MMGTVHENIHKFVIMSCWILCRIIGVSERTVEKVKAHISCSVTFFQKLYCLWDSVV